MYVCIHTYVYLPPYSIAYQEQMLSERKQAHEAVQEAHSLLQARFEETQKQLHEVCECECVCVCAREFMYKYVFVCGTVNACLFMHIHCTALHCTSLQYTTLHYTTLQEEKKNHALVSEHAREHAKYVEYKQRIVRCV
jgi:uncharacterized 2Fe-2S/4Fe-4S cluster protein (DUF4445 family)